MLVQAVHLLHRHRGELGGTIKFMFQPGEEGYGGARLMIEDGLLDTDPKPDAAFALHIAPNFKAGGIVGKGGPIPGPSPSRGAAVTPRCRMTRSTQSPSHSKSGWP
jgi:hippurate hydrolase